VLVFIHTHYIHTHTHTHIHTHTQKKMTPQRIKYWIKRIYICFGVVVLLYIYRQQLKRKGILTMTVVHPEAVPVKNMSDIQRQVREEKRRVYPEVEKVGEVEVNDKNNKICAVIICRIYEEDKAAITLFHLYQWLIYMRYAGIHHVYLYDTYHVPEEKLEAGLGVVSKEWLTYHDWSGYAKPFDLDKTQVSAYQHAIDHYSETKKCDWQIAVDVDEYPTSERDKEAGFLERYTETVPESVSEVSMLNYLLIGGMNTMEGVWLGDKYSRLTKEPGNQLVKPLYRPKRVKAAMHHNVILSGEHRNEDEKKRLRLTHIWGARIDGFSREMSPHVASISEDDETLHDVLKKVKMYVPVHV
jgi:hypothetical protein